MAIINFALIAQSAQPDPQTNLISISNVLETITYHAALYPAPMPGCMLVMLWERTELPLEKLETAKVKLTLESPLGTHALDITGEPIEIKILEGTYKSKALIPLSGMPIKAGGINRVVIWQEQKNTFVEVGEIRFNVITTP